MMLSTRARYGLRLMIDLADQRLAAGPVVLRDVAGRQQISKRYLEQVASSLKNASLVTCAQGRGGGYWLARSPETIPISDIVAATIGPVNIVACVKRPGLCQRADGCPSRDFWVQLNDRITDVLKSVTLADLCERNISVPGAPVAPVVPCGDPCECGGRGRRHPPLEDDP